MTRKQLCALAAVTAMLVLTGSAVWKLGFSPADENDGTGGPVAILTCSIVLYLAYLFSTLPNLSKTRNK